MRLIQCDKCGWTDNDKDLFFIIKIFSIGNSSELIKIDLCTKCYQLLDKWIKDKKQ